VISVVCKLFEKPISIDRRHGDVTGSLV